MGYDAEMVVFSDVCPRIVIPFDPEMLVFQHFISVIVDLDVADNPETIVFERYLLRHR